MKPYYQDDLVTLYHGDCREVLPTIGEVDLVVTDPPYGTGGWRRLKSGAGSNPSGSLVREEWDNGSVAWLELVSAPIIFTFWPAARTLWLLMEACRVGLPKHRCLYMRKLDPKPQMGGRIRWSVEPIWALSRDGVVLIGGDDVWEASTPRLGRDSEATGHPYQKPLGIVEWLIAKIPAGLVLDPFTGSGTTLVAARLLGRCVIGIEIEERYCEMAARRLSQEVLPLTEASRG